jgi:anhydro-N-acetylmuramic acid kinase
VAILSGGRLNFDKGGKLAGKGRVHDRLVDEVLAHSFFRRRVPASTGREDFGEATAARLVRLGRRLKLDDESIVASVTMATARSIARSYKRLGGPSPEECFVCGGGALNPSLMSMLAGELTGTQVATTAELGVDPEAVEAVAFAVLGFCTLAGEPSSVPAVTGARGPRVLGKIAPGANFKRAVLG